MVVAHLEERAKSNLLVESSIPWGAGIAPEKYRIVEAGRSRGNSTWASDQEISAEWVEAVEQALEVDVTETCG